MKSFAKCITLLVAAVAAWALLPDAAAACEMCWGAGVDTPTTRGISMAMFSLIGVVALVGGGIGAFFYHVQRRSDLLGHSDVVVTEYGQMRRTDEGA